MATKKQRTFAAGRNYAVSGAGKRSAASALTGQCKSKVLRASPTSGKIISRTIATHRDALKRLADR